MICRKIGLFFIRSFYALFLLTIITAPSFAERADAEKTSPRTGQTKTVPVAQAKQDAARTKNLIQRKNVKLKTPTVQVSQKAAVAKKSVAEQKNTKFSTPADPNRVTLLLPDGSSISGRLYVVPGENTKEYYDDQDRLLARVFDNPTVATKSIGQQ